MFLILVKYFEFKEAKRHIPHLQSSTTRFDAAEVRRLPMGNTFSLLVFDFLDAFFVCFYVVIFHKSVH